MEYKAYSRVLQIYGWLWVMRGRLYDFKTKKTQGITGANDNLLTITYCRASIYAPYDIMPDGL